MLLKNGSITSVLSEVEKLSQELGDVEIHCKDRVLLWNRSLLAAWSPMLRFGSYFFLIIDWPITHCESQFVILSIPIIRGTFQFLIQNKN